MQSTYVPPSFEVPTLLPHAKYLHSSLIRITYTPPSFQELTLHKCCVHVGEVNRLLYNSAMWHDANHHLYLRTPCGS